MRKKRKSHHLPLKLIVIPIFLLCLVGTGYAYLTSVLKISGNASGLVNKQAYTTLAGNDTNFNMDIYRMGTSSSGGTYNYQYTLDITNLSSATINNFKITIECSVNVKSINISNYDYAISGKTITITNNTYKIGSGAKLRISFSISSTYSSLTINAAKIEQIAGPVEVDPSLFTVNFAIVNSTGQYTYDYNVTLTNNTGTRTNTWQLDISLPQGTIFVSGLDAVYSYSNGLLIVKNNKSNGKINNTASLIIRMQLTTNIVNFIPTNVRVTLS